MSYIRGNRVVAVRRKTNDVPFPLLSLLPRSGRGRPCQHSGLRTQEAGGNVTCASPVDTAPFLGVSRVGRSRGGGLRPGRLRIAREEASNVNETTVETDKSISSKGVLESLSRGSQERISFPAEDVKEMAGNFLGFSLERDTEDESQSSGLILQGGTLKAMEGQQLMTSASSPEWREGKVLSTYYSGHERRPDLGKGEGLETVLRTLH
uniref:Uncharacterized protein n=1 Tax=Sphaerodactylus townsendi TaxID=933632 RepID=A0ACB8EF10_9SAUR